MAGTDAQTWAPRETGAQRDGGEGAPGRGPNQWGGAGGRGWGTAEVKWCVVTSQICDARQGFAFRNNVL